MGGGAIAAPQLDLAAVKSRQRQTWATGDFHVISAGINWIAECLCESADLVAGWRVLDVACGSGNLALAAARRGCEAAGVDYVPTLVARGRMRAAAEGLPVDLVEGDAEELPFPDASFDAVLSVCGVMFCPDQERAASELVRVCRPGGRIALANWPAHGWVGDTFRVLSTHVAPPPGLASPFDWATPAVERLLGDGVRSVELRERTIVFRLRSAEDYLEQFRRWFGPVRMAFETVGPAGQEALARDLTDLVRAHARPHGDAIAIEAPYVEVIAERA